MAVIQLHGMFYDIRNKVGNLVYSKWRQTNYVRQLVIPFNPQTVAQQDVRYSLARLVDFWQQFNSALKAAWNFIATGQDYSGYNRFVGVNRVLEQSQGIIELSPHSAVQELTVFTPTTGAGIGSINLGFGPSPVPAGHRLDVYAAKIMTDADKTQLVYYTSYAAGQVTPKVVATGFATGTLCHIFGMLVDTTLNQAGWSSSGAVTTG